MTNDSDLVDELAGGKPAKPPEGFLPNQDSMSKDEIDAATERLIAQLQEHDELQKVVKELGFDTPLKAITALRSNRAAIVDECAKVAEGYSKDNNRGQDEYLAGLKIAREIRSLNGGDHG